MDDRVDIADVTKLIDVLMGSVLADYDPGAADVNRDGVIDIGDVTLLIDLLMNIRYN